MGFIKHLSAEAKEGKRLAGKLLKFWVIALVVVNILIFIHAIIVSASVNEKTDINDDGKYEEYSDAVEMYTESGITYTNDEDNFLVNNGFGAFLNIWITNFLKVNGAFFLGLIILSILGVKADHLSAQETEIKLNYEILKELKKLNGESTPEEAPANKANMNIPNIPPIEHKALCPKCGNLTNVNADFCGVCGNELKKNNINAANVF